LRAAIRVCNHSDLMRAAKALGLWVDGKVLLPEHDEAAEMLSDIALFEPNQRAGGRSMSFSLPKRVNSMPLTSH
jgi:hypothetical protein